MITKLDGLRNAFAHRLLWLLAQLHIWGDVLFIAETTGSVPCAQLASFELDVLEDLIDSAEKDYARAVRAERDHVAL